MDADKLLRELVEANDAFCAIFDSSRVPTTDDPDAESAHARYEAAWESARKYAANPPVAQVVPPRASKCNECGTVAGFHKEYCSAIRDLLPPGRTRP